MHSNKIIVLVVIALFFLFGYCMCTKEGPSKEKYSDMESSYSVLEDNNQDYEIIDNEQQDWAML